MSQDLRTAEAFATSWNALPSGSIYTFAQFEDWLAPLTRKEIEGRSVLELGCGNASILVHLAQWAPSKIAGIDLGRSTDAAEANMRETNFQNFSISRADLTQFSSDGFDVVLCIGVLHHLADPVKGFESVIANVKPGGRFHCWVYAREGNRFIINVVDPIRRIASRLPWMITKYLIAAPLAVVFFSYAKLLSALPESRFVRKAPLFEYSRWISQRTLPFFRHVAFDQLVSPRTVYIERATIDTWLGLPQVAPNSTYVVFRNGNSWKFGGRVL